MKYLLTQEMYLSNSDVQQTAQKTQSSDWVLKLNLYKIIFWNILKQIGFKLTFKINYLPMSFSILSYYLPPRPTRAKGFTPWSLTRALQWTPLQSLQDLQIPISIVRLNLWPFFRNSIFFRKQTLVKLLG